MTLHVGNNNIVNIHHGSDRIYRVYKGSDLVWRTYKTNEVVFESATPGVTYIDLRTGGRYRITTIGAGGGGCGNGASGTSYSAATGAAGGGLIVDTLLPIGRIGIAVGAGGAGTGGGDYSGPAGGTGENSHIYWYSDPEGHDETFICRSTGGGGGRAWFRGGWSLGTPGSPSTGSYITDTITSVTGSAGSGGANSGYIFTCPVPITGINYGNGGRAMGSGSGYAYIGDNGSNGYVKIVFLGE